MDRHQPPTERREIAERETRPIPRAVWPTAVRWRLAFGTVLVASALAPRAWCQDDGEAPAAVKVVDREAQLKAAFLYNFGHYITWPDDDTTAADVPFVVGFVGKHEAAAQLQRVASARKRRSGPQGVERPVEVRQFDAAAKVSPVHILFIARGVPMAQVQAIVAALAGKPTLLVGEDDDFLDNGGMIALGVKDNRIHLSISLPALEKSQLKPGAALMRITPDVRK